MGKGSGVVKMLAAKHNLPVSEVKRRILRYGIAEAQRIYLEMVNAGRPRSRQTWYEALRHGLRMAWNKAKAGELPPEVTLHSVAKKKKSGVA